MPASTPVDSNTSRYHVPNLERALVIMEYLSKHPEGKSVPQIVSDLKIPKNSVFRITMTLMNHGYLCRDENSKILHLTRKLLSVGYTAVGEVNLIELSLDEMRDLRAITHETVMLGTILGEEGVIMEKLTGFHPFSFSAQVGTRFNLHTSAPGKAIIAYLPNAEKKHVLDNLKMTRFNSRTITTRKAFETELQEALHIGYAVDRAEEFENCHCVAAPILDQHGYPVASLWTTGPAERLTTEDFDRIGNIVREHADSISRKLGFDLL